MFGIGTSELVVLGFIAKRRLPVLLHQLQQHIEPLQLYLRDRDMAERFKKFLWSPRFCVLLGIIGCATGLYFQGVAANGSGLWCLGLIFLGVAYLDKNL